MRHQDKQIRDSTVMSGGFAVSEKGPALGKVASGAKCLTIISTFVGPGGCNVDSTPAVLR